MALVFGRTAEVLQRSAVLAEDHAERCAEAGRLDVVDWEREAAERAREGALLARLKAAAHEELFRELDELERRADERDRQADERERRADERERHADKREQQADGREHAADDFEARLEAGRAPGSIGAQARASAGHELPSVKPRTRGLPASK